MYIHEYWTKRAKIQICTGNSNLKCIIHIANRKNNIRVTTWGHLINAEIFITECPLIIIKTYFPTVCE